MENDDKEWVEVKLHREGVSSSTGSIYPPEVIRAAIEKLQLDRKGHSLRGEYGSPDTRRFARSEEAVKRFAAIDENQVCCEIDLTTMCVKDGFVVAMVRPAGPLGHLLEKQLSKPETHFGMRALVQYEQGNTTQTANLTVRRCDMATFDLINPPT
jgi:hypothetical protein